MALFAAASTLAIPALIGIWLLVLRRDKRLAFDDWVLAILLAAMALSFKTFVDYSVLYYLVVPLLGGDGVAFGFQKIWATWGGLLYLAWPATLAVILWRKGIVQRPGGLVSGSQIHGIQLTTRARPALWWPLCAAIGLMVPVQCFDAFISATAPGGVHDRAGARSPDGRLAVHLASSGWLDADTMRLTCEEGGLPLVCHNLAVLSIDEALEANGEPSIVWSRDSRIVVLRSQDGGTIVVYDFSTQSVLKGTEAGQALDRMEAEEAGY